MASSRIMKKMEKALTLSRIKPTKELSRTDISTVTESLTTAMATYIRATSLRIREKVVDVFKLQG